MTIEEIDQFLDRLMNESPGKDYTERLGRKWWYLERKAGQIYGCPSCAPEFQKLYNVKHNTVNLHLNKPVVDSKLYEEGMRLVMDGFKKYLDSKGHSASLKEPEDALETIKGVKVAH